jgi:hypothetical protein
MKYFGYFLLCILCACNSNSSTVISQKENDSIHHRQKAFDDIEFGMNSEELKITTAFKNRIIIFDDNFFGYADIAINKILGYEFTQFRDSISFRFKTYMADSILIGDHNYYLGVSFYNDCVFMVFIYGDYGNYGYDGYNNLNKLISISYGNPSIETQKNQETQEFRLCKWNINNKIIQLSAETYTKYVERDAYNLLMTPPKITTTLLEIYDTEKVKDIQNEIHKEYKNHVMKLDSIRKNKDRNEASKF